MEENKNKISPIAIGSTIVGIAVIVIILVVIVFNKGGGKNPDLRSSDEITSNSGIDAEDTEMPSYATDGDFDKVINYYELKGVESLEEEEKVYLSFAYLDKGNLTHNEKEYSKKALDILNTLENDDFKVIFHKGYAYEIIKDYTGAIDYYKKGLDLITTAKEEAIIINQIGHVYDLMGDMETAFEYYTKAYNTDNENISAISNLGRYYVRKGEREKGYNYMKEAIEKDLEPHSKAEIYYGLSSLELNLNGNIEKSIEYAQKGIEVYDRYMMNYQALARGYYMQNDETLYSEIEKNLDKVLEIIPDSVYTLELYAMHELDKGNYDKFEEYLYQATIAAKTDMILMDNERELYEEYELTRFLLFYEILSKKDDLDYIYKFLIDSVAEDLVGKKFIKEQLMRKDYGILNFLKDDPRFETLKEKIFN